MKKYLLSFAVLAMAMSLTTACSSDDDDDNKSVPEPKIETITPTHFDLTVTLGKQGGMGRDVTTIMLTRDSLNGGPVVDFQGVGAEINTDYTMEAIVKGRYYYQVPMSADRFLKFQFKDNKVVKVQEQKFVGNTYNARQYTHAFLNDSTLIVMAASGDKKSIIWTKLNTGDMRILGEGKLNISLTDDWDSFTTSGILTYRQSDNKLFYFYFQKKGSGRKATSEKFFHVVVIDAKTMEVEQNIINSEANEMAGSAYGELLQNTTFFDENGNLYLACFKDEEQGEIGRLLRIKKGETNFEAGYNGFTNSDGKLLTVQYLGNGKVFTYSRHDDKTLGTSIDSYAHYYSVIDLNKNTRTRLSFGGKEIAYSSGRFSQRSAFDAKKGKVFFGVNTETAAPCVYIYDVATGTVTKGVDIKEGYYFEQIRLVEGDPYTVKK